MAIRTIREYGDEVLEKECKEVTKVRLLRRRGSRPERKAA